MKKIIIPLFVFIIMLHPVSFAGDNGGGWYKFWERSNPAVEIPAGEREKIIRAQWKTQSLYDTSFHLNNDKYFGRDLTRLLLNGLKEKSSVARWYSAYKISEYLDSVDKAGLRTVLVGLYNDEVEEVRQAARFTVSMIDKDYCHEWFVKSPDGKKTAFVKYNGVRCNSSDVWIIADGKINALMKHLVPGTTGDITWSPDSEKLAFTQTTGMFRNVAIFSINSGIYIRYNIRPLSDYIREYGEKYGIDAGKNGNMPYQVLNILKWKNDGSKLLLSYSYGGRQEDGITAGSSGKIVYDLEKEDVTEIIKDKADYLSGVEW
jgi:hypothetical protein